MYKTLLKLKNRIAHDDFVKMCDNALEKGKITKDEYDSLVA